MTFDKRTMTKDRINVAPPPPRKRLQRLTGESKLSYATDFSTCGFCVKVSRTFFSNPWCFGLVLRNFISINSSYQRERMCEVKQ